MAAEQTLSKPAAAAGITVTSNASPWVFGAWVELDAGLGVEHALSGIQFQYRDITAGADNTREFVLEVGLGAAGSEVTKIQIPFSERFDTAAEYILGSYLTHFLPEPFLIPASTRIAVRQANSNNEATTINGIKLYVREIAAVAGGALSSRLTLLGVG